MRVDLGSHRLHPSIEPSILADLRRLLGDELQPRERNGRIRLQGRWISFPLRGKEILTKMPPAFVLGAARDALTSPVRRSRAGSFADVLQSGLGRTICNRFYFPYARKIWGVEPEELSAEQARRRVSADSPLKVLARALRGSKEGGAAGAGYFLYPEGGYGTISEALAEGARAVGADIHLGTAAERIRLRDGGAEVETSRGVTFSARRVWSTLPITVLARMVDPPAPDEVIAAASALRSRAMVLVYLVLDVDRFSPFDAHYLPEAFTPVTRFSEPKNYRRGSDPVGRTVLCAEIPCDLGDATWKSSTEELGAVACDGIAAAGLPRPQTSSVEVRRLSHAYPIYLRGYEPHFDALDKWAADSGILTFGRQGLFAHDNAHHALAMASAAAKALDQDGSFNDADWAGARERFGEHVVED